MHKTIALNTGDQTIDLVLDTINNLKQALVFANTKRSAEKAAEDIAKAIKDLSEKQKQEYDSLSEKALNALSTPTKQCKRLAFCLKKGIAFHHAGLVPKQKEIIEDNFRKGNIKAICATPTLAMGIDIPAYRTIMKDLRRFGHRGLDWIPTLEYLQMAGRAGRPKYDITGQAIAIASTEPMKEEIYERYVTGEPEEVYSKLAVEPVLRTYLLSLIAAEFVKDKKQIIDFFSKTFWAFQYRDMTKLTSIIEKMLKLLIDYGFITSTEEENEFRSAADMFNHEYKATPIGKRIAELYIDPYTANHIIQSLKISEEKELSELSFLQMISSTLEMRPLLRIRKKEYEDIEEALVKYSDSLLQEEPSMYEEEYGEFLNSIKTALFFRDWINEIDEETILEKYSIRPGETRIKLNLADWLFYCSTEFARMIKQKDILKELTKLRLRLKHGAKEELLPLLKLKGIGRVRARKMFSNKIKTIRDIKRSDPLKLSQLVGKKTAINIKEQVGQKVTIASPLKRKGQKGLKT